MIDDITPYKLRSDTPKYMIQRANTKDVGKIVANWDVNSFSESSHSNQRP